MTVKAVMFYITYKDDDESMNKTSVSYLYDTVNCKFLDVFTPVDAPQQRTVSFYVRCWVDLVVRWAGDAVSST